MSTTTSNLGLTMPALTDVADITVINTNMTLIDTAIEANDTAIASNTTSIASINTSLALTNQNVSTNTANIATINGEITTTNSNVTSNTNSINTLNTEVAANTTSINTLNTEVTTITQNTTNNTTNIATVSNNLASHSADDTRHENYVLDTSTTVNTMTGISTTYTAYADGSNVTLKVKNTNTGATTLNINGLGVKPVKDALGNAINAGTLVANNIYFLVYEVTYGGFILANCIQSPVSSNGSAGTVKVTALPSSGTPVALSRVATCMETEITSTSATNVLTYTPTAQGNFEIETYLRVVTASTNVTITATYTDGGGAQTVTLYSGSALVGSYMTPSYFFNSVANQAITLTITAGTANQVYVSSSIVGV
jgi:hypothetical protein